jgi:hypothetical protein
VVYGRFLEPEARKAFFEAYKDIESLWEILSPSPELRDHITTSFKHRRQSIRAILPLSAAGSTGRRNTQALNFSAGVSNPRVLRVLSVKADMRARQRSAKSRDCALSFVSTQET